MVITVMSRKNALNYFRRLTSKEKKSIACISITGMEDEPVSKWHYPKTTLYLTFDDVDRAYGNEIPMSHYEANRIAFFVKGIAKDITGDGAVLLAKDKELKEITIGEILC